MKKYMDGLAKKHYDNDDENGYDKIKQVYREHRLLSLSSKGLLEVAAFKVFLKTKTYVRNCQSCPKMLLTQIYPFPSSPLRAPAMFDKISSQTSENCFSVIS